MQFQRSIEPYYNNNSKNRMFLNDSSSFLTTAVSAPAASAQVIVPVGSVNCPKQSKWAKLGRSWRPSNDIVATSTTNNVNAHDTVASSTTAAIADHDTTGTLAQSSLEGKVQVRMIQQNDVPIYNDSSSTIMNTTAVSSKSHKTLSNTFPSVQSFSKSSNVVVMVSKESVDKQTLIFKKKSKKQTVDPSTCKPQKKKATAFLLSKKYTKWEYGKLKTFSKPEVNVITNAAATMIIKHIHGWYQKLKYRIQLVQYKLSTVNERANTKINEYQMSIQQVKTQAIIDRKNSTKKLDKQLKQSSQTLKEGNLVIEYLKKENTKLRQSNTKLVQSINELQQHNSILENTTQQSIDATNELQQYLTNIQLTNTKLNTVLPKYSHSIQQLQNNINIRNQYYTIEKNNKLIYSTLLGTIVQMMQNHYNTRDTNFVTSIVNQVLTITTTTTAGNDDKRTNTRTCPNNNNIYI